MRITTGNVRPFTNRGQAISLAAFFFLVLSLTFGFGVATPVINETESIRAIERGAQSFYASEGALQDVAYRLIKGMSVDEVETLSYGAWSATATTTTVSGGKEVTAAGLHQSYLRKSRTGLSIGSGTSFHYGVQAGEGGIILENTSSVLGNVFSNGQVNGSGNNMIRGDAISAEQNGLISGVHATGTAYAHTIQNSEIDKDAHFQTISNTTVHGTLFPGSDDQATSPLPISDEQIEEWKSAAEAGGVISAPCPYQIEEAETIGPVKIACDLEIKGTNFTLTLSGPVWVEGNIKVQNSPTVVVDPAVQQSIAVIADNPSQSSSSGTIQLENSAVFEGGEGTYVLFISQNNSAEQGGGTKAIQVQNSVTGDLLVYAGHGEVEIQNSVELKEVTAYRIRLKNSAQVQYEAGLANLLFSSGPGGGYVLDSWKEVE